MLHVAVNWSFSDGNVIHYTRLVLWMTSFSHNRVNAQKQTTSSPGGGIGGEVCCLWYWLHLVFLRKFDIVG